MARSRNALYRTRLPLGEPRAGQKTSGTGPRSLSLLRFVSDQASLANRYQSVKAAFAVFRLLVSRRAQTQARRRVEPNFGQSNPPALTSCKGGFVRPSDRPLQGSASTSRLTSADPDQQPKRELSRKMLGSAPGCSETSPAENRAAKRKIGKPEVRETTDALTFNGKERSGAWRRIRTTDTRIFNPLLYQLSYPGARFVAGAGSIGEPIRGGKRRSIFRRRFFETVDWRVIDKLVVTHGYGVASRKPAAQIDVGAAPRAERAIVRMGRMAFADRAVRHGQISLIWAWPG